VLLEKDDLASEYTLIGTTDSDHNASLDRVRASSDEVAYLCESASTYCRRAICPNDVVWSYSGVRLLLDEGVGAAQAATPDYKLDLETDGGAALLAVLGGKITTYRQLAEQALALLEPDKRIVFAIPYEGGDFAIDGAEQLVDTLVRKHPRFDRGYLERLANSYGTRAARILDDAQGPDALGRDLGGGLREAEARYLVREEWAMTAAGIV
jgi:glycerol-3-phosphate dehydrogenase